MLTPLDIHNKVFSRVFRGYKMEEVDAFLDEIIRDQEIYFRENKELKDRVALLEEEISRSREISAALEKTMLLAQKVHGEESARAKKEADVIVQEAENRGEKIVQEAEREALDARQKIEHLRLYEKQLYLKHKGFLEFQMELLDGYKDKEALLTDGDMDKLLHGGHERELAGGEGDQGQTLPDVVSLEGAAGGAAELEQLEMFSAAADGESAAGSDGGDEEAVADDHGAGGQKWGADIGDDKTEVSEGCADSLEPIDGAAAEADDRGGETGPGTEDGGSDEPATDSPAADGKESPFIINEEIDSMEKVVLLAQKMEEALEALDDMYGSPDE
jgi:cell division initiation protein